MATATTPPPSTTVSPGVEAVVPPQLPAGQPYFPIDMRHKFPSYICSSDNPRAVLENGKVVDASSAQEMAVKYLGASWPCDMNAAQVVSVGLTFSFLVFVSGLLLYLAFGGLGKPENVPGGQRMNDLCALVRRGIRAFSTKTFVYFGTYSLLFFFLILIVFSPIEYYDKSDGIRYAGSFFIPFVLVLWFTYMSVMTSGASMVRTARATMNPSNGLSAGLRSAFCGASAGAWIVLGGILLLYTFMYLIMSSNRTLKSQFKYYLSCDANPAFCGQTIAAQTMVAFCCGVSCASFLYRSTAGIFAKASEIGSELVHKLEPDNLTSDKMKNPATIADKVGAALLDAGGGMLDVTETMCLCMVAAQIMAEGDSARLSLTFMYPGCALLASLIAFFAVRCSDQGAYISDRHISSCWGFRFGLYGTHVLVALFTLIMTGAVYGNYPFDVLREGNYRKTEGWPFFGVHLVGQCGSILLWEMTSFFTSHRWFPTRSVTAAGITGPATMLVQGLGVAMISCIPPMVILGGVVLIAHASAGQFGVAIAALGFWSPAGFVAAANAVAPAVFGADDCLDHPETQDHRQRTVPLVMAGESQSAEYRGWSVVAAMLSSFAVLCAFKQESGMATGGIGEPFMTQGPNKAGFSMGTYRDVMPTGERGSIRALESEVILEGFVASWAMTGGFSTILIAGISTLAIGKATRNLVDETRAQLNRDGAADPEGISGAVTFPAIAGSMLPAFYIVLFPVCVGFFAGPRALGAFSVGAILAAGPFATVLFNAGASWAKSKTAIEAEGVFNGSGSDSHLASISTARAGGALKDVAAPCICAYIKAISIWSLMMAPTIFISPYMPFVIDCAVKRMAYESIFTCMDWNKAYWAVLPGLMLLAVTGIIYVLFWNRDGTAAPESPAVPKAPMAMSSMPPPIVTNPVMYGPPPFEYAQYTQEVGPVMMTAQPPYQSAGIRMTAAGVPPAEPMMAAPMRPQSGLGDFVQNGYVVEGYGGYRA